MDNLNKILIEFVSKEKKNTCIIIILSCILSILKINILSYITSKIIKSIEQNNITSIFSYYKYFIYISLLFIILLYFYKKTQSNYLSKLRTWTRCKIFNNLLILNNEDYVNKNYGELNNVIIRVANSCFYFTSNLFTNIIPNISLIIIVSFYFLYNNLIFGIIFIIGNILIYLYFFSNLNRLIKNQVDFDEIILKSERFMQRMCENFEKIIYKGEIINELKNLWDDCDNSINYTNSYYNSLANQSMIINLFLFLILFILIFYLIYIYIKKKISSTIFITFITILLLYRDIILNSSENLNNYIDFLSRPQFSKYIFKDINCKGIDDNKIIYKNNNLEFNSISFENINFKYKFKKNYVLQDFSYKFETDNKILGITGSSGIGKSTFAKLLIKYNKYEGDIFIDGINLKKLNTIYIRKNIVYVNQDPKLLNKKVIDNIYYGCDNKEQATIYLEEIMKFEIIKELLLKIGFNTKIIKSGENLSGGQRQVINLINGLITPSKILILDEPTNALDRLLKMEIINVIRYFKKYKKCIIIISHDSDIFSIFDEHLPINNNLVVKDES
jgi:ABC-type bacteriocin/lantibiotic exporter with double-glycine peptidase domain